MIQNDNQQVDGISPEHHEQILKLKSEGFSAYQIASFFSIPSQKILLGYFPEDEDGFVNYTRLEQMF